MVVLACASASLGVGTAAADVGTPRLFGDAAIIAPGEAAQILRPSFSPDGNTVYFTKSLPGWSNITIVVSSLRNGRWSAPSVASFSGVYRDSDPFVTKDGRRLFFASVRPVAGVPRSGYDIYYVDRVGDDWGAAHRLGDAVNATSNNGFPSVAADGTLYLTQNLAGGRRVVKSVLSHGEYTAAEPVDVQNLSDRMLDATIAWDQRTMVFSATRPKGADGSAPPGSDLWLARRRGADWGDAQELVHASSGSLRIGSSLSPDNRTIYYSDSSRSPVLPRAKRADGNSLMEEFHTPEIGLYRIYELTGVL